MKVGKHFTRSEFACRCGCGFDTVDVETIKVLDDLRDCFEQPVHITSGCRCYKYNREVGGQLRSQHVFGRGADVVVHNVSPITVYAYLDSKYKDQYGIGKYQDFTHVDTRTKKARW
jgi:uncharacterized protein YcbK (DUF882 family)